MNVRTVDLTLIDAGGRLRALDPAWVDFLAEEIGRDGLIEPIRVVARGDRFRLVSGARRVAACLKLGHADILAIVVPEEALADDAAARLGEVQGNLLRGEPTVLERAYYVEAWRDIYLSAHALPKRGRKPKSAGIEIPVQRNNISGEGPEPNQLWQIDASPVDALCTDGRHSIYVCIDIATRRGVFYMSRTPRAEAVGLLLRKAILAWGVPSEIKTDAYRGVAVEQSRGHSACWGNIKRRGPPSVWRPGQTIDTWLCIDARIITI